jgi:hypothetical protein
LQPTKVHHITNARPIFLSFNITCLSMQKESEISLTFLHEPNTSGPTFSRLRPSSSVIIYNLMQRTKNKKKN